MIGLLDNLPIMLDFHNSQVGLHNNSVLHDNSDYSKNKSHGGTKNQQALSIQVWPLRSSAANRAKGKAK
jgi:hypothetical protein